MVLSSDQRPPVFERTAGFVCDVLTDDLRPARAPPRVRDVRLLDIKAMRFVNS